MHVKLLNQIILAWDLHYVAGLEQQLRVEVVAVDTDVYLILKTKLIESKKDI